MTRKHSSRKNLTALLCISLCASIADAQQTWPPTAMDWYCASQSNGETLCSLLAEGVAPTNLTSPISATATYRILKGRTHGVGPILLTSRANLTCQKFNDERLVCGAADELRLGVGVKFVMAVVPPNTTLTIYTDTPRALFDWDGDGQITPDREGVMLQRYLMGFRGDSITSGIPLTAGNTSQSVNDAIAMGIRNEWFEFIAPGKTLRATQEGLVFNRCASGLRGAALVSAIPNVSVIAANAKCAAIMAIE